MPRPQLVAELELEHHAAAKIKRRPGVVQVYHVLGDVRFVGRATGRSIVELHRVNRVGATRLEAR